MYYDDFLLNIFGEGIYTYNETEEWIHFIQTYPQQTRNDRDKCIPSREFFIIIDNFSSKYKKHNKSFFMEYFDINEILFEAAKVWYYNERNIPFSIFCSKNEIELSPINIIDTDIIKVICGGKLPFYPMDNSKTKTSRRSVGAYNGGKPRIYK